MKLNLSPRQREIMRLICAGKTDKEIASDLGMASRSVSNQVGKILRKLYAKSRANAVWIFAGA